MDELSAWLTLVRAPGLHSGTLQPLLDEFGGAVDILRASAAALGDCGASPKFIDWLHSARDCISLDTDKRWLDRESHHFVPWRAEHFPKLLCQLPDGPIGLYVRGSLEALSQPQLAMVGSRNPTPGG